jgi:probable F420-dependent oxidoreductase
MKVGAVFSQADSGTDPAAIRGFATGLEAAGYHHLMAYDHILGVPASMFPGKVGNFPSAPYTDEHPFHEVLVLFSHLAAVTTSLEFVTSVLVIPQRQTAVAAKQIATIDLLSGGRLHVAVGVGWNNVEYGALGTDFATRTQRLAEQVLVMKRLWLEPLVTFAGDFHQLDHVGINPRPTHPIPVWMGTNATDAALRRVVAHADGWMPLIIPGLDPVDLATAVTRLRQLCDEAGRDPAAMPVWSRVYLSDGWQNAVEEALTLGCTHFSIGARRGQPLGQQLGALLAAMADVDRLVPAG